MIARFQKGQPAENNTMPGPAMIKETTADVNTLLQFATKVSHRLLLAQPGAYTSYARCSQSKQGGVCFPSACLEGRSPLNVRTLVTHDPQVLPQVLSDGYVPTPSYVGLLGLVPRRPCWCWYLALRFDLPPSATPRYLLVCRSVSSIPRKAKEGIKRKIAKGADQSEIFDAVVSVQRQLILFHERKEGMQLLMDRSLAVLAHLRKEEIQVKQYHCCRFFLLARSFASFILQLSDISALQYFIKGI